MKLNFSSFAQKILLTLGATIILPIGVLFFTPRVFQQSKQNLEFSKPVQNLLVVFAHPDDEITNAGLIRSLAEQGTQITLLTLTDGAANPNSDLSACNLGELISDCRIRELNEAAQILGISKVVAAQLPDSALTHHVSQAVAYLSDHIKIKRPDAILTMEPSGLNRLEDHVVVSRIVARATRESKVSTLTLLSVLPAPFSWFLPSALPERYTKDIRVFHLNDVLLQAKASAALRHRSQAQTIRGLTLGLGPETFFRWINFETYAVVQSEDLQSMVLR